MKKAKNRERILIASVDLFNTSGVVAVTTNHIADHLTISPGNLYFHFRNKEEIVGSSRVDLQACKLEYSIVSPK